MLQCCNLEQRHSSADAASHVKSKRTRRPQNPNSWRGGQLLTELQPVIHFSCDSGLSAKPCRIRKDVRATSVCQRFVPDICLTFNWIHKVRPWRDTGTTHIIKAQLCQKRWRTLGRNLWMALLHYFFHGWAWRGPFVSEQSSFQHEKWDSEVSQARRTQTLRISKSHLTRPRN